MSKYNIDFSNCPKDLIKENKDILTELIESFCDEFDPIEKDKLLVLSDNRTGAIFCECHIKANLLIEKGTIDVPLDPDEQPEYRANRKVIENHAAFLQMKDDAIQKRMFSNIVSEFIENGDEDDFPLKIIGGQHRYLAIEYALENSINEYQGIKVYFSLDVDQRLDVQLISNTNIAISSDLLDRMYETVKGPELRKWCQECGLLESDQDFADRKQRGSQITVRGARTFIINYFKGKPINSSDFDNKDTTPYLAESGSVDDEWEKTRKDESIWKNRGLKKAGKEFAKFVKAQNNFYTSGKNANSEFADKGLNYSITAAWAYVAGVLQNNKVRLDRHYGLANKTKTDPLNAKILAQARHKTDVDSYRGLGARTDAKERGRMSELFFKQAEIGDGINKKIAEYAIQKHVAKQATLKVKRMEENL